MQRGDSAIKSEGVFEETCGGSLVGQDAGRFHTREDLEHASSGGSSSMWCLTREVFNLIHVLFTGPRIIGKIHTRNETVMFSKGPERHRLWR